MLNRSGIGREIRGWCRPEMDVADARFMHE
jgi:hypothetical protein